MLKILKLLEKGGTEVSKRIQTRQICVLNGSQASSTPYLKGYKRRGENMCSSSQR